MPLIPLSIYETNKVIEFLKKRELFSQYKKSKKYILEGIGNKVHFKKREPKDEDIWYFRINKQYRAWCIYDEQRNDLSIFKIDNHQNS